jgi:cell division protein FtsN
MEKQKIFWVVLSVSVFVVVVLVVGVLLLRQKPVGSVATAPGTVSPLSDSGTQIYEYQKEATPQQPAAGTTGGEQKPGDTQTMHFYIGEGSPAAGQGTPPATVTPPAAAQPQPAPEKPAATVVAKPAAAPQQKAVRVKTTTRQKTAQRTLDFWIQTGSYKSQSKAEELSTRLEGKGLNGRVLSYASKGETFYRVRIGPYGNKDEAGKFLSIVKQIQGLEASYISQARAVQNLN